MVVEYSLLQVHECKRSKTIDFYRLDAKSSLKLEGFRYLQQKHFSIIPIKLMNFALPQTKGLFYLWCSIQTKIFFCLFYPCNTKDLCSKLFKNVNGHVSDSPKVVSSVFLENPTRVRHQKWRVSAT